MRPLLPRLAAILAVPTLLVAGCASEGTPTASATPSATASGTAAPVSGVAASEALAKVKVSGAADAKPTVALASTPTSLSSSGTRVLAPGTGAVVTKGQKVTVDYVLVNGKDGKEADTTFGKTKATFLADPGQLLPGLANGMIGQKIGSRVLVGVAPQDGFAGGAGNQQLGFSATDALIFVLDINSAVTPPPVLAGPQGAAVAPVAGLPTVADKDGVPTVTVPKTTAPTKLVAQVLIKGTGATVAKGQTLTANYVGVVWADNRVFDSSFGEGKTKLEQAIGVGALVPGFDAGIVGQTIGSRVLLVLPPDQGYGTTGNVKAGIKGTDTLVFVVDILGAS